MTQKSYGYEGPRRPVPRLSTDKDPAHVAEIWTGPLEDEWPHVRSLP